MKYYISIFDEDQRETEKQVHKAGKAKHRQPPSNAGRPIHASPPLKRFLSLMQLTVHVTRRARHGASRVVHAEPAWSVKTRRAPSRYLEGCEVIIAGVPMKIP